MKAETKKEVPLVTNGDEPKTNTDSDFSDEDNLPSSSFKKNMDETTKLSKKHVLVTRKIGLVKRR